MTVANQPGANDLLQMGTAGAAVSVEVGSADVAAGIDRDLAEAVAAWLFEHAGLDAITDAITVAIASIADAQVRHQRHPGRKEGRPTQTRQRRRR